jgi:hypothetical protein
MPSFIEAYNRKFAKVPRYPHDAHRPLRPEEDLDQILAWRELRKVSQNLLLHYERRLVDTPDNRRLGANMSFMRSDYVLSAPATSLGWRRHSARWGHVPPQIEKQPLRAV